MRQLSLAQLLRDLSLVCLQRELSLGRQLSERIVSCSLRERNFSPLMSEITVSQLRYVFRKNCLLFGGGGELSLITMGRELSPVCGTHHWR